MAYESFPSNELSQTPAGVAPDAPTLLVAVGGDEEVGLSWNASAGASNHCLYYGTAPGVIVDPGNLVPLSAFFPNPFPSFINAQLSHANQTGLDISGDISLDCWFKLVSFGTGIARFVTKGAEVGGERSYTFGVGYSGGAWEIEFFVSDNGFWNFPGDGITFPLTEDLDQWHHAAGTWNESLDRHRLYLDGVLVAEENSTGRNLLDNGGDVFVGYQKTQNIANVRVWDSEIDLATVNASKDAFLINPASYPSLKASWSLTGGLKDSVNSSNDLTDAGPGITYLSDGPLALTSEYNHLGLTNGTSYYYIATAKNASGESPGSNEASATPSDVVVAAPVLSLVTPTPTQNVVSFCPVPGATSYNIYFGTSSGVTKGTGTQIAGVESPYTHTGLTNGQEYFYVVTAVSGAESPESNEDSGEPLAPSVTARYMSVGAMLNGVSSSYNQAQIYEELTNEWKLAAFVPPRIGPNSVGDTNRAGFIETDSGFYLTSAFAGNGGSVVENYTYNPATDAWISQPSTPSVDYHGPAVYVSAADHPSGTDRIYMFRSASGAVTGTFCEINPNTGFSFNTAVSQPLGVLPQTYFQGHWIGYSSGYVVLLGGRGALGITATCATYGYDRVYRYDLSLGTWNQGALASSLPAGFCGILDADKTIVTLTDGRVLINGPYVNSSGGASYTQTAVVSYHPGTNVWQSEGNMSVARFQSTILLLSDGRVMYIGGKPGAPFSATPPHNNAEIYDGVSWSVTSAMNVPRTEARAVELSDGRILVVGGTSFNGSSYVEDVSCEIYDPVGDNWTLAPDSLLRWNDGSYPQGTSTGVGRTSIIQRLPDQQVIADQYPGSAEFGGTSGSDYYTIANLDQLGLNLKNFFFLETWFKSCCSIYEGDILLISKWRTASQRAYSLEYEYNGGSPQIVLRLADEPSVFVYTRPITITPDTWVHIGAGFDTFSNQVYFMFDGVQQGSADSASGFTPNDVTSDVDIGYHTGGAPGQTFRMAQTRMWESDLFPSLVTANYNKNIAVNYRSGLNTYLVAYWKMNGNARDSALGRNDLTKVGNVAFTSDSPF